MAHLLQTSPIQNQLLSALSPESLAYLRPELHLVSLPVRRGLYLVEERIDTVYFIERGWVSMVASLDDESQAEVGFIGREGMVGATLAADVDTAFSEIYMQAGGAALQMDATAFQRALDDVPNLRRRVLRYNEALHAQTTQTAACNGRHDLEQRLARWLLMAHDRSEGDDMPLIQEFLAVMLCVYRSSITAVTSILQKAGMIRCTKEGITVLDRRAIEATACDCYSTVQKRFKHLLG